MYVMGNIDTKDAKDTKEAMDNSIMGTMTINQTNEADSEAENSEDITEPQEGIFEFTVPQKISIEKLTTLGSGPINRENNIDDWERVDTNMITLHSQKMKDANEKQKIYM